MEGEDEGIVPRIFNLGTKQSVSSQFQLPIPASPRKLTHRLGGYVGPRAHMDFLQKKIMLFRL